MLRTFYALLFLLITPALYGQWTKLAYFPDSNGDTIVGGMQLLDWNEELLAIYGRGRYLQESHLDTRAMVTFLRKSDGGTEKAFLIYLDSGMTDNYVGYLSPRWGLIQLIQYRINSQGNGTSQVSYPLYQINPLKPLGFFGRHEHPSDIFIMQNGDTLMWRPLGKEIVLDKLNEGIINRLSFDDLPQPTDPEQFLSWHVVEDSLYAHYFHRQDSIHLLFSCHQESLVWGPTRSLELEADEWPIFYPRAEDFLIGVTSSEAKPIPGSELAERTFAIRALNEKPLIDFKIRTPYQLVERGITNPIIDTFHSPVFTQHKGQFFLFQLIEPSQEDPVKNNQTRLILTDGKSKVYYDNLLAPNISASSLALDSTGAVYVYYQNYQRGETGVIKIAKDGVHPLLSPTPSTNQTETLKLSLYPNPAQNRLRIGSESDFPAGSTVRLYGLDGALVHEEKIRGFEPVVLLPTSLENGIYLMQVRHAQHGPQTLLLEILK